MVPGVIQSFDSDKMTVTVQPCLNEQVPVITAQAGKVWQSEQVTVNLPLLADVPLCLPGDLNYTITFPNIVGSECLVIFADMCMDSWWQNGGVNNTQLEQRRHDIADGFAILRPYSQKQLPGGSYSANSLQIKKNDGSVVVDLSGDTITLTAPNVTVNASGTATIEADTINITGTSHVNITGAGSTKIENKTFLTHLHSGVSTGGSNSGPVF
jgi:hypothetical protein